MQYSKWLAKLGSVGYDLLILINSSINFVLNKFGREKISFSRRIKNSVKSAVSYINKFEETAADIAISKGYTHVVCGHIHQPEIRKISNQQGEVIYLNSGDWIENMSALEYHEGQWRIYNYREDLYAQAYALSSQQTETPSHKETFEGLLKEFNLR
jgi:UDP-2,3-diacylglucosamine pyrophosphatase LpxH